MTSKNIPVPEPTDRAPRNSRPLTAAQIFERIADRRDRRESLLENHIAAFHEDEAAWEARLVARCPTGTRDRLDAMLATLE